MKNTIYIFVLLLIMSSCTTTMPVTTTKSVAYKKLYEERPLAILALPPINKSTNVEAKELFYSSLAIPFTLKGYYVISPLLAMEILKEESAYDAEMFVNSSMKNVGTLFGVDAVLFTTIHEWTKTTITSQIRVTIEYVLKSTKTDEVLFNRVGSVVLCLNPGSGYLLLDMLVGAISTSLTKEIRVGRDCNFYTISDIPAGKYSPDFGLDGESLSQPKEFNMFLTL